MPVCPKKFILFYMPVILLLVFMLKVLESRFLKILFFESDKL